MINVTSYVCYALTAELEAKINVQGKLLKLFVSYLVEVVVKPC